MSSTDELLAEIERDEERQASGTDTEAESRRSRVASRLKAPVSGLFSPRAFLLALVLSVVGMVLAGVVPLVPGSVAALVGVFLAGFLLGLVRDRRAYLEVALAGAGTAVVATLSSYLLVTALSGYGVPLAAATGGAGLLAAVGGHYFGRDLRDGLTRDL
jgi:Flp pilus assembly protein TadB